MKPSLDLSTLESHLWEAANILRGPVDAADFKTYIFPLLFFKRISDVYDEETQQALKESEGDEGYASFPEQHRFQVPPGCHWRDVRAHTTNVGQALQNALRGIEQANPRTLYGIFGDAQWTNRERLSDALLCDLVEHFPRLPLPNSGASTPAPAVMLPPEQAALGDTWTRPADGMAGYSCRSGTSLRIQRVTYTPASDEAAVTGTITAHARQSSGTTPNRVRDGV